MGKSFKKVGDWDKLRYLSVSLRQGLMTASNISVKRFGLIAEKIAKQHISSQDLPWAPLSQEYKAGKKKHGFSEKILVRTSTYFQSITAWSEGLSGYAGVKKGVREPDGEEVADIAKIHEYGSSKHPARPLWQPTFEEAFNKWKASETPLHIYKRKNL
jgi:hypothetical protein